MPEPPSRSPDLARRHGPGWAVTAAFVGPGTVTTMTLAGSRYGFDLVWTVVAAVAIAIVLQEMAARLAIANQAGLSNVLRERLHGPPRYLVAGLVVTAILVGNTAFQTGNLAGAALGLQVLRDAPLPLWAFIVANAAFLLLWLGRGRHLIRWFQAGVALMGLCFVFTLAVAPVDWLAMLRGLAPTVPAAAGLLALGAIGTTVVPYNFFLHAALVKDAGWTEAHLGVMRRDTLVAIAVGGVISLAILATSAALLAGSNVTDARGMAQQLRPLLGDAAAVSFGLGIFLAGLTSAVTAPFAAAFAITQTLGGAWTEAGVAGRRFRGVWLGVLAAGLVPILLRVDAIAAIVVAQALNGILLPVLAVLLLVAANDARTMGRLRNTLASNLAGAAAVTVAVLLGLRLLFVAAGA